MGSDCSSCCLPSAFSAVATFYGHVYTCSLSFPLPVNLPVDSPWPLLLCKRKKSLLLSVTQSFRAFLRRTSSGFSHISSKREGPAGRNPKDVSFLAAGAPTSCLGDGPQALERPGRASQQQGNWFLHDPPAPPTAAGFGLPRLVSSRPCSSSCTHSNQIAYEVRRLTLMLRRGFKIWGDSRQRPFDHFWRLLVFLLWNLLKICFCSIISQLSLFNINDNRNDFTKIFITTTLQQTNKVAIDKSGIWL